MAEMQVIYGRYLDEKTPPHTCEDPMVRCWSPDGKRMDISSTQLSKHILIIGSIGMGKTNAFNYIIDELDYMTDSDIMIIFDTKGDFKKEFYQESTDCLMGNSSEYSDITVYWNIFREIEYGGGSRAEKELMAKEIAKLLFDDRKNSSQPFFSSAACDIFSKILIGLMRKWFWEQPAYRKLEERLALCAPGSSEAARLIWQQREMFNQVADQLNNKVLVDNVIHAYGTENYTQLLNSYPDFRSALNYIGDGKSTQALGVFGELNSMVNDYFIGVFAGYERGRDVSIRQLVHEKNGRKLFIEYDLSVGEVLTPVYKMLVDLGLKEALGRNRSEGNVFLIIDEFKLLPRLTHMDDALNFGRSLGIKAVVGLQNIRQLEDIYGETKGQVIAAGFSNVIAFRMMDEASRKYVSELFGRNYVSVGYWDAAGNMGPSAKEGYTVEDWQLMNLQVGQAVIGLSGYDDPFYFRFQEWKGRNP